MVHKCDFPNRFVSDYVTHQGRMGSVFWEKIW
jgi:hypothetical protein